jgi:hypothetical protein
MGATSQADQFTYQSITQASPILQEIASRLFSFFVYGS